MNKEFSPKCKKLEITLIPNGILADPEVSFDVEYKNFSIKITLGKTEQQISIISNEEVEASEFETAFFLIHKLQAVGIGYFFEIKDFVFSDSSTHSSDDLAQYAQQHLGNLLDMFKTSTDFKDSSLSLMSPQDLKNLICAEKLETFEKMYVNLTILYNGFWYQSADTGIPVDMRCAFIIQCYQHFERADSGGEKPRGLSAALKCLLKKYPVTPLPNEGTDLDNFTKKLTSTRNLIMHFDTTKKRCETLSAYECAGYARILHIYFRFIVLKQLGVEVKSRAESQINTWLQWMERVRFYESRDDAE